jgi:hypothetical protein
MSENSNPMAKMTEGSKTETGQGIATAMEGVHSIKSPSQQIRRVFVVFSLLLFPLMYTGMVYRAYRTHCHH